MIERLAIECLPSDGLCGRRKIYTDKKEITPQNVSDVIEKAYAVHLKNRAEIQYLYDFYRGRQDVRYKKKEVRPEINNKVMINRANEIVTFKTAYLLGEPLQYVSNGGDDSVSQKVNILNEFMRAEDKSSKDKEIADWMHICGVGVRMVLPDASGEEDGSPVSVYTLDPRESFVIYYSGLGNKPLAGVLIQRDESGREVFCVYTKDRYYEIKSTDIQNSESDIIGEPHLLGRIPIVEYLNNDARMGAFEVVLPILNAINTIESNRVDSIQDFVNAYDVFQNCEIPNGAYAELTSGGKAIQIRGVPGMEAKVYRISSELNQTSTQTVVDDLQEAYLTICGMPNRNGGSSTSDTGQAVIYRDGFAEAESRAKDTEKTFIRAEWDFLRLVLRICRDTSDLDLKLSDIKPEFTRKNLSNIQSKAQVLAELLNNDKVHPKLAFQYSGMFADSEEAYRISMEWYNSKQEELTRSLRDELNAEREQVQSIGQSNLVAEEESDQEI